jgi:hypothetical protein
MIIDRIVNCELRIANWELIESLLAPERALAYHSQIRNSQFTIRNSHPDISMKIFTIEEANALLPTVRSNLRNIQKAHRRLSAYREQAKEASEAAERGGGGFAEGPIYAQLLIKLTELMNNLESLGVQVKDLDRGLVDFPYLREGRVVLLCWQMGEGDEVEWWHDLDAGFAGRTPL